MLSKNDLEVLEEIVELEGGCLSTSRCLRCPFRAMCLPEFCNPTPPSKGQRFTMALDVITYNTLMDDPQQKENIRFGATKSKQIN